MGDQKSRMKPLLVNPAALSLEKIGAQTDSLIIVVAWNNTVSLISYPIAKDPRSSD